MTRRPLLAPLTLILAVGTTACTGDDREAPDDAVAAMVRALSADKPGQVPWAGDRKSAVRWWNRATEGLGESRAKIAVDEVTEDESGDRATADLTWTWTLEESTETWEQTATARLVRGEDDRWRVRRDATLLGLRGKERLDLRNETAARAPILGAGGAEIVVDRPVLRFGIDKTRVPKARQAAAARELAAVVDVDPADLVERVAAAGDKAFVEAIVLRREEGAPAKRAITDLDGAVALEDTLPLAPTREFARPILGTVGPVTAEIVKESDGAYEAGDEAGLSGLQMRYDDQLRGTPGLAVVAVDGDEERELFHVEPEAGQPLSTTLDLDLQAEAERILAAVGPASALVAIRPSTGDVVAAASGPGSDGYSTATVGQYAPGSTFKVVSSLALLRAGLSAEDAVSCPGSVVVDGKRFENYDDYPASGVGRITLREAVADSCNTAFISERDRVKSLGEAAAALGLGVDHDLGFPAYFGSVPEPESETSHAASLIGQGQVLASPMAMATVMASVVEGRTVLPRLLPEHATARANVREPLTANEAGTLRALLRAVVTQGSGTQLADVPGPQVIAKTGTAEFGDAAPLKTHAWMVAGQGDLAVAAFVEVGESGSSTAGPLIERLLRAAR